MAFTTRVMLLRPKGGRDAGGQPLKGYDDVEPIWADWRSPNGLATISADARTSLAKASVRVRRRAEVGEGWALRRDDGSVFEILAIPPNDVDRINMDLVCQAVKA